GAGGKERWRPAPSPSHGRAAVPERAGSYRRRPPHPEVVACRALGTMGYRRAKAMRW
ncbi:unnamed protein product, partial [Urochloa humidicola]